MDIRPGVPIIIVQVIVPLLMKKKRKIRVSDLCHETDHYVGNIKDHSRSAGRGEKLGSRMIILSLSADHSKKLYNTVTILNENFTL